MSEETMLEDLLRGAMLGYINQHRSGNLEEWSTTPTVVTEDIPDKVFGIRDVKGTSNSIKCAPHTSEATYYNGDEKHQYVLRFIRYEEFINQFRSYKENGQIDKDWTKNLSRPDYMAYDVSGQKHCMIIHELSQGNIRNKHKDGKKQLLNTVLLLSKIPEFQSFLNEFQGNCYCFLSAQGCVDVTPNNVADSFMEIYKKLPDPLPIDNFSITKRGFKAFETKVIRL